MLFMKLLEQNINGSCPYPLFPILVTHLLEIFRPPISGLRKHWCPEIVDLMERMWAQDANDRPDMTEVVHELERLYKVHK